MLSYHRKGVWDEVDKLKAYFKPARYNRDCIIKERRLAKNFPLESKEKLKQDTISRKCLVPKKVKVLLKRTQKRRTISISSTKKLERKATIKTNSPNKTVLTAFFYGRKLPSIYSSYFHI